MTETAETANFSQQEVPKTLLPGNDELILHGISAQFMPTIAKCSLGGWIVVVRGKGISAWTSLDEAIDFVGKEAHLAMGEELPEVIKNFPDMVTKLEEERSRRTSVPSVVASLVGMALLLFAVKFS